MQGSDAGHSTAHCGGRRAAQANAWLVEMQASQAAWQLAPQLMQAAAEEVRFYGASTLYKKCRTDIAQVPAEARAPLLGQLLSMAAGAAAGPVRRHLCLAVAATVVAASEAVGGLAGLLGHAGFAALPKVAMLEILSFLPAEVNDSTLSSRQRDAIVVTLKEALPTVFGFVTAEAAAEDEATLAQVVAVVEGWAAQGTGLSLPLIATSAAPIYTLLFRLVQADSPLASSATAALCSAIEATTREQLAQPGCFAEIGAAVLGCRLRYDKGVAEQDDDACGEYARLAAALAGRGLLMILKGGGGAVGEGLLQGLLDALQHTAISVAEIAHVFWEKLPDAVIAIDEVATELSGPLHSRLAQAALRRAALSRGFAGWGKELVGEDGEACEEDEFGSLRIRLKDLIQHCASMLGPAAILDAYGAVLLVADPPPSWEVAEATLFACSCVATAVAKPKFREQLDASSAQLVSMFGWVLGPGIGLLAPHPVAQQTAAQLVAAYASWMADNRPELADTVLQWLLAQMGGGDALASTAAAKCFCEITKKCQHLLAASPPKLVELIGLANAQEILAHGVAVRRPVAEGLSRVVALVSPAEEASVVSKLVAPLAGRLGEAAANLAQGDAATLAQQPPFVEAVAAELVVLGETVRFLEGDAAAGAQHPACLAIGAVWPSVTALVGSALGGAEPVAEAFSTNVCAAAFGAAKAAMLSMLWEVLQLIGQTFAASRGNAGCPATVGVALEIYGGVSELTSGFTELVGNMSTVTFELVRTDVGARPALVTGYFTMLYRATLFCPEAVVGSPALSDILQLIIACLALRDASICGQLFATLLKLIQSSTKDPRLLAVLGGVLGPLVRAVLFAIADTAPAHQLAKLSDVLQCLLGGPSPREILAPPELSQAAQQAAGSALSDDGFPSARGDAADGAAHREKFLRLLMPMVHGGRRFRPFVKDFSQICRGEQTIDALVAYEGM